MRRGESQPQGGGLGGRGGQGQPLPCQRSRSSATMFKTRNEASSAFPFGRPPTSHGRNIYTRRSRPGLNSAKQFSFNAVSETRNAFALSKPNSYSKIPSRFYPQHNPQVPVPHPPAGPGSRRPVPPAITSFAPDPSYDSSLGGVSQFHAFSENRPPHPGDTYNKSNSRIPHSTSGGSRTIVPGPAWKLNSSSASTLPYIPPTRIAGNNMVSSSALSKSQSQSQVSLLDQKKRQWAKEREELSGLWSPWGKENKNTSEHHNPSDHGDGGPPFASIGGFMRPGGNFATYSSSDHYLPPINDTSHQNQNSRLAQRSHSLIPGNELDNRSQGRKGSVPDEGRRVVQLQPYEQRTTFHKEGNAEWMIIHNGNGEGGPSSLSTMGGDGHDRTAVISPRVIVHKIVMDASEDRSSLSRIGPYGDPHVHSPYTESDQYQRQHPYHHPPQPSAQSSSSYPSYGGSSRAGLRITENGDGDNRNNGRRPASPLTRSSFGGSTGYLGHDKPPPTAMRSHLDIGLPSPRSRFGGSFEDIEKKEKQQWLHELDMQREEQRLRKLREKDDKRARWGDKGVGVGHFWEPSMDSSRGRLPSRENHGRSGGTDGGPSPPAWAKRSIEMQNSLSQPNLYNGPLPAQMALSEDNIMMNGRGGQSQGHIANFNRSSIELSRDRSRSRSPGVGGDQQRTFLRGQNAPLDLNEAEEKEKEKKAKARQEYLEDVKKQIEDNKRRQKEEKEKQEREDREHERRMMQQRELDMQRLEMEKQKKKPEYGSNSTNSQDGTNLAEPGIQIFESSDRNPHTTRESEVPLHESPLIPNRFVPEPDAYELAIARRQAMTLSHLQQSQSTEKSDSTSLSSEFVERNFSNDNPLTQRSTTPTPPTVVSAEPFHHLRSNEYPGGNAINANDQCLMTDSDHIYERTLTPTNERRSRSMDTRQVSREFGTQTEVSDLTTDADTDRELGGQNGHNSNDEHSKRSKSISNLTPQERDKKEEKPRWGANPERKVYMKQSEKDPNYQKKLRRRQQISGSEMMHHHGYFGSTTGETDTTTNDYETENSLPFHRVQNRARTKERDRIRRSRSPLKASTAINYNSQSNNYFGHGHTQSHPGYSQSHVSSHLRTDDGFQAGSDITRSSLRAKPTSRSPPKTVRKNGLDKGQAIKSDHHYSGSDESAQTRASIAQKHLGHIRDGLNSVGGSEESCTGSGYTSPSSLRILPSTTRPNCSTGESNNSSLPSSASNSNSGYVPMFSTDFKTQRDFDETPIRVVKSNPYLDLSNVNPVVKRHMEKIKSSASTKPNKPSPMAAPPKPRSRDLKKNNRINERATTVNLDRPRILSPPVPALAKKMEMGLRPDGSGRISSLPLELLSPIPRIPLGTVGTYSPRPSSNLEFDPSPSNTDGSRLSSAEPKVDIDIAITHASNPDLQELLYNIEQSAAAAALTARSEQSHTNPSLLSAREDELSQFPELISARTAKSGVSGKGSRPVTNATDLSLQAQEEFIRDLMSNREVQQQLSARDSELSEKGIIEFNIKMPSSFAPSVLTSGKSRKASSRSRDTLLKESTQQIYRDPLISHSERRKATVQWLHSLDESSSSEAILTNLSSLKQGIKMQHELVHSSSDM